MSARDAADLGALAHAFWSGSVGVFGAARWYRRAPSRAFWIGLRSAQVAAIAYALLAGALDVLGEQPQQGLFYLYALLPLAVAFVAEQLRIVAADQVLAMRDIDDAQEVGELPADEQQAIVVAILRREMGVMAASALVVAFLALRAAGTY